MSARSLVLVLLSLTACVDLTKGRPWRCEQDTDCSAGWRCLKDLSCHAPDAGADVPCGVTADCTGGWICGNARRCLDPAQPADFPCSDDSQCVGGWRCGALARCVDFSKEPRPAPFVLAPPATPVSPLTEPTEWLSVSPPIVELHGDGGVVVLEAARPRGTSAEVVVFASERQDVNVRHVVERHEYPLGFEPRALAVTWGMLAVVGPDGGFELVQADGGLAPDAGLGFAPSRLVPLAWSQAQWVGIAALSEAETVVVFPDGTRLSLGPGIRDIAATTPDGGMGLLLLRVNHSDLLSTLDFATGKQESLVPATPSMDTPSRLRLEGGAVAVSFDLGGFVAGRQGVQLICPDCPTKGAGELVCTDSRPLADFGVLARESGPVPVAVCASGTMVAGTGAGAVLDFREGVHAGTSGAHVQQLPTGQLLFSHQLGEEVPSVLATRPRALTWRRDGLVAALAGRHLFLQARDAGDTLGLSLAASSEADDEQFAGFVEGDELLIASRGYTLGGLSDGGVRVDYIIDAPELLGDATRARLLPTDAGVVLVVSDGDTLYSARREDPEAPGIAEARLRPAAGFTLTDWDLRPGAGALLEGWAVANNRLFRLTASSVERWRATEVTFPGRDPLGVWFAGDSAVLGTATGQVLALPSGVPLAPPLGDVLSIDGLCGAVVATTNGLSWQLDAAPDGGLGVWRPLLARPLEAPRVVVTDGHLLLADENGVVLDVAVSCP